MEADPFVQNQACVSTSIFGVAPAGKRLLIDTLLTMPSFVLAEGVLDATASPFETGVEPPLKRVAGVYESWKIRLPLSLFERSASVVVVVTKPPVEVVLALDEPPAPVVALELVADAVPPPEPVDSLELH